MKSNLLLILLFISVSAWSQKPQQPYSLEFDYLYGSIFEHNPDISHLIKGHPTGFELSYNNKTFGKKQWERFYNYPDWGVSFMYQDMGTEVLGKHYALYANYGWYFFNRNLNFKVGTGVSYNTNPYDKLDNPRNNAYGTSLLSTSYFRLNYVKENLFNGFGIRAGMGFIHYSNGSIKSPNTSTNTITVNVGLTYQLDAENFPEYIPLSEEDTAKEKFPIGYNFSFKTGVNESDVIGLGQHQFYILSGYADKRFNKRHSISAGIDVFASNFLKRYIEYRSVAFPEDGLTGNEDHKRVGIFGGYELRFHKNAINWNIGYYLYWPYKFETRIYNRYELKRYFFQDKFFGVIAVKSHFAKAETIAFGVGYRL